MSRRTGAAAFLSWVAVLSLLGVSCEREAKDTVLVIHPRGVFGEIDKLTIVTTLNAQRSSLPTVFPGRQGFAELDLRIPGGATGHLHLDMVALNSSALMVAQGSADLDVDGVGQYALDLTLLGEQVGWSWCHKCQGLFFSVNPLSACPAGGGHEILGSFRYLMHHGEAIADTESGWRWCRKCQGLHDPDAVNVCPRDGKAHDTEGSFPYVLRTKQATPSQQDSWRRCGACGGLYFSGNQSFFCSGRPNGHDPTGSGEYFIDNY